MYYKRLRAMTATLFLSLGYLTLLMQWLWLTIVIVPPLLASGRFNGFLQPTTATAPVLLPQPEVPTGLAVVIIGFTTLVMIVLSVVILLRIPKTVRMTSEMVLERTAEKALPVVTNHARLTKKKRRVISRRLVLAMQLLLSILPAVICLFLPSVDGLSSQVIQTIALLLVGCSVTEFAVAAALKPSGATSRIQ